ncbi:WXG100 family type VII secretion target, partial [Streptomyces flaveolus]|uniref:WXG100 family type VII secretion target n=1 Tax=Streptomyces flaveolus TaxID=67297 RepID=UPI0036FDD5F4
MPDYNQGGFNQDDSGIYGDPTVQGSPSDYDSWDWKQIMAAITGGSNLTPGAGGDSRASGVSDPQTMMRAANDFQYVQEVLAMVGESLAAQAKALAGGDGAPWQGEAADTFLDTMTTFSRQVTANAEALGGGSTGSAVGQNLVWSANALTVAQANIHAIDVWYANQAIRLGVKAMPNGLIPVSQKPEIVEMMTNDMRAELKKLASNYAQVSQSLSRVQPKPVTAATHEPETNDPGTPDGVDPTELPTVDGAGAGAGPTPDLASVDAPGAGGGAAPFTGTVDTPALAGGGGAPSLASLDGGPAGADPTGLGGSVSPYPGTSTTPELSTPGGGPSLGGLDGSPVGADPTGLTGGVSPYPSTTTTPEFSPVPDPGTTAGGTGAGATLDPYPTTSSVVPDIDSVLNPSTTSPAPAYTAAPIPTSLLGTPSNSTGGAGTGTGTPSTVGGLTETPEAWTGGSAAPGLPGATLDDLQGTGTGAADLPTGLGGAPDGSALPAMPTSELVSSPTSPSAEGLGGTGLAGMPMMPGMGAANPAGAGAGGAERPDAAGLLGGEGVVPWDGAASLDDVSPVAGAASGGAGLTGPEVESVSPPVSGVSSPGEAGGVG